jgi:hypothetical protein
MRPIMPQPSDGARDAAAGARWNPEEAGMANRRDSLVLKILGLATLIPLAVACSSGGMTRDEPTPLALDIYTADLQGLGVTSTLIYGQREPS